MLLCVTEGLGPCRMVPESQQQVGGDLVKPQKLPNPIIVSHQHRALHQELLLCHRRWENMQLCTHYVSEVQPQEGTCRSTNICSAYAFVHLQLHNPKRCSVFCVGTWDIQFLKVAINLCMGYSLGRLPSIVSNFLILIFLNYGHSVQG